VIIYRVAHTHTRAYTANSNTRDLRRPAVPEEYRRILFKYILLNNLYTCRSNAPARLNVRGDTGRASKRLRRDNNGHRRRRAPSWSRKVRQLFRVQTRRLPTDLRGRRRSRNGPRSGRQTTRIKTQEFRFTHDGAGQTIDTFPKADHGCNSCRDRSSPLLVAVSKRNTYLNNAKF